MASPSFTRTAQDGLITVGNRSGSSWDDGIPDSWRLLWFGTVSNALSAANADPDGDGASNWEEYVAGTNPLDPASVFQFLPGSSFAPSSFTLQWPSVVNKSLHRAIFVQPDLGELDDAGHQYRGQRPDHAVDGQQRGRQGAVLPRAGAIGGLIQTRIY